MEGPAGTKCSEKAAAWQNTILPVTLNRTQFLHDLAMPSHCVPMQCPGRAKPRTLNHPAILPARPGTAATSCHCQRAVMNDPWTQLLLTSHVKIPLGDFANIPLPGVSRSTHTELPECEFVIRTRQTEGKGGEVAAREVLFLPYSL